MLQGPQEPRGQKRGTGQGARQDQTQHVLLQGGDECLGSSHAEGFPSYASQGRGVQGPWARAQGEQVNRVPPVRELDLGHARCKPRLLAQAGPARHGCLVSLCELEAATRPQVMASQPAADV